MTSVPVNAASGDTQYYSIAADTLQKNVIIQNNRVYGTLHNITSYPEFNPSDPTEQKGHFLVLTFDPKEEETVKTKIAGGPSKMPDYVDATSDKYCVYRIQDKYQQKIYVKTEKDLSSVEEVYDLSTLKLE